MSEKKYILEVDELGINFGGLRAVNNFSMKIEEGQLYGLIGPNGAGKTTVFNMKYINHPVMGDDKYGQPCPYMDTQGQVLHASELTLVHPTTGETMTFHAPLPAYFEKLLGILRKRVA